MIDPAGVISVDAGVDYIAIIEREKEGVVRLVRVCRRIVFRLFPWAMLSFLLDDPGSFANLGHRKNAPAVDARLSDHDPFRGGSRAVAIGTCTHGLLNHNAFHAEVARICHVEARSFPVAGRCEIATVPSFRALP